MRQSSQPVVPIPVLIADSNRMQSRLLASALQRRPEFRISICAVDSESIVKAIPLTHARVVLHAVNPALAVDMQMAAIRQVHLSNPGTAKILLSEFYNRELVIAAFRSGARGIFCVANTHLRSHTVRDNFVGRGTKLRKIFNEYQDLKFYGYNARYEPPQFTAKDVTADALPQFNTVKAYITKLL